MMGKEKEIQRIRMGVVVELLLFVLEKGEGKGNKRN